MTFPVCFAAGTLIRTPGGDVPVEALQVGDAVLMSSGALRPIKWLGHRVYGRGDGEGQECEVVRIAAHAFGQDRPSADLTLSPGHAVCVDVLGEVLIPVHYLVNGATIVRERRDQVALWHVELDSQDVLLANDLPAESYLAMGNRGFFEEDGATLDAFEEGKTKSHEDFCRPVVIDGAVLAFVRDRLLARARALGWTESRDDDLRLMVDGRMRTPLIEDGAAAFVFPAAASDVRLLSDTFRPSDLGFPDDRVLGARLFGLVFSCFDGDSRRIAIDDERLREGAFGVENDGKPFCWTKGEVVLDPALWSGLAGAVMLLVACDRGTVRHWIAPPPREEPVEPRPKLYAVQ